MRIGLVIVVVWLAAPVSAQAPMTALVQAAEQAAVDAEKALEAAAPVAYKAFVSAIRVRNQARALEAAEKAKAAPKENGSK